MSLPTQFREPIEFAAGDTLLFTRSLPDFPASKGWSLKYELRGQSQAIEFTSTPVNGDDHSIAVAANVTALWQDGDWVLTGYAVNAAERHQIYYGELTITPNMPAAGAGDIPKTLAQRMLEKYEALLLEIAEDSLLSSQVGRENRFEFETRKQIREEHAYWFCVRANEISKQRAKEGLPTGNKIRPVFNVIGSSVGLGVRPL